MNNEITVKLTVNSRFFNKTYIEIIKDLNVDLIENNIVKNSLKENKFNFKTFLDLESCSDLNCKKCEGCMFLLFLKKKLKLRSRNKNTWSQANDDNYKYFHKLKIFHCHLININEYQPWNNNILEKPIYKELKNGITSNLYLLYKEEKKSFNEYSYEILFICKHPNKSEWNKFKNELSFLVKK